jgi:hypothetical protein
VPHSFEAGASGDEPGLAAIKKKGKKTDPAIDELKRRNNI